MRYYRSSNSKHCSSNRNLEFEHFSEIISISVISKKIYLTSLKLQHKPGVIKMKITQWNIWHIFRPRWTKHFIFGHFIAIVAIVISFKNSLCFHRNCRYNSHLIEDLSDITEALTQTILIKLRLRIWTFHRNCCQNSHLKENYLDLWEKRKLYSHLTQTIVV